MITAEQRKKRSTKGLGGVFLVLFLYLFIFIIDKDIKDKKENHEPVDSGLSFLLSFIFYNYFIRR